MTNKRHCAGVSGVMALLAACLACTSLQDLSAYSAGPSDGAAPPDFQPPAADDNEQPLAPLPDAGAPAAPVAEARDPADLPLLPTGNADAGAAGCTGPAEFTAPDSSTCYRLGDTTGAWRDARAFCQGWGGDLAQVQSPEENSLLSQHTEQDAWLGASDVEDEGTFRWVNGDDVDLDSLWASAQPDNYEGREDCMELRQLDDRWNDAPCMSPKVALCERAP